MNSAKRMAIFTLVLALGIAATHGLTDAFASDQAAIADSDKVYAMVYKVSELPVWSQDGEACNPAILMSYLKATVDADGWEATSAMQAYPQNCAIVISTTSGNHEAIARLLEQLRD